MPDRIDRAGISAVGGEPTRADDRAWFKLFVMQLTIQRVAASGVGKAVADVRSHCTGSDRSPREAFGDPRAYATTLAAALPSAPPQSAFDLRRMAMLLPTMLGLAILAISYGAHREAATVSVGQLLLVIVAVPAWVVLTAPWARRRPRDAAAPHRPAFDENGWRGLWVTLGLFAVGAALWIGFDHTVFTVSKWLPIGLGVALLSTGFLVSKLLTKRISDRSAQ
jgi:hypothetical protein